ncbi:MAG TPA: DUF4124 domain-containing protein [Thiobacillus sp.]|nr:MAG: DUF4124 domain-containing protein [Hydrogenophilales bacterium 16-64-40]OZA32345.1 MAG: DUF4124 domain-containing protein [Hydrogenophilales bacterium 17-64-65]HQS81175.1 DUF4124 domain-containing protein [Thiobacillus sp.]HQT32861.1 DUF4124 domain-containing protein [Thiobacillus sp.]
MRLLALLLLALPALLPAGASAQATLNKCIDAEGKVTYSNLPCLNARQARKVEIDLAPEPDQARPAPVPVEPEAPRAAPPPNETATLRLDTQRTTGKPAARTSARQCDTLTDKLGRVFDKMDQARRKGYTQKQMDAWNLEVQDLERKKQQSACF